jgi:hypothetical protein
MEFFRYGPSSIPLTTGPKDLPCVLRPFAAGPRVRRTGASSRGAKAGRCPFRPASR